MISFNQILGLFLAFLFGLLGSILLHRLRFYTNLVHRIQNTPANLVLFAKELNYAIINNETELDSTVCSLLYNDYHIFCKIKELQFDFDQLTHMYHFLKAKGYQSTQDRIDVDTALIDKIMKKYDYISRRSRLTSFLIIHRRLNVIHK